MLPMSYAIRDILLSRSREEIEATLDYFNALPLRRGRKQDLVNHLCTYLSDPSVWLEKLMEQDLRMLQRLCAAGPDTPVEMFPADYPSVLEVLHFIEVHDSDKEDMVQVSIPAPFYELIAGEIEQTVARKEKDGSFELEHFILGAVNYYGIVPLRTFVTCMFRDFDDLAQMRSFARSLAEHPVVRLYQETYKGEAYLVSPFVENYEEQMRLRAVKYKQVRKYAAGKREDVVSCGLNSPFCFYGAETPEGRALLDMLYEIGYEGEALQAVAHSVWYNAQFEPDEHNTGLLLYPVTSVADEIGSLELFSKYINIIVDYANRVPKWLLKGRTANETGLMAFIVSESYVRDLYGPEVSESENEELLKFFSKVGKVQPVGPDEPCPCGSGLSYRHCHGRHYS